MAAQVGSGHSQIPREDQLPPLARAGVGGSGENGQGKIEQTGQGIADAQPPFGDADNLVKLPAAFVNLDGQLFDFAVVVGPGDGNLVQGIPLQL